MVPVVPFGTFTLSTVVFPSTFHFASMFPYGVTTVPLASVRPRPSTNGVNVQVLKPALVAAMPSTYLGKTYVGAAPHGWASEVNRSIPGEPSGWVYLQRR